MTDKQEMHGNDLDTSNILNLLLIRHLGQGLHKRLMIES